MTFYEASKSNAKFPLKSARTEHHDVPPPLYMYINMNKYISTSIRVLVLQCEVQMKVINYTITKAQCISTLVLVVVY